MELASIQYLTWHQRKIVLLHWVLMFLSFITPSCGSMRRIMTSYKYCMMFLSNTKPPPPPPSLMKVLLSTQFERAKCPIWYLGLFLNLEDDHILFFTTSVQLGNWWKTSCNLYYYFQLVSHTWWILNLGPCLRLGLVEVILIGLFEFKK